MKGVLFLFTKTYVAGARNTEEFVNPLISSVEVTINGVPNSLIQKKLNLLMYGKDSIEKSWKSS